MKKLVASDMSLATPWLYATKKIPAGDRSINPQKVGSKPERCERVYKRTAQAQRDFLRKRRNSEAGD